MTDSREYNASTVEKALAKASEDLGIPEADLSFEVVDSGSDGFLGIGARDARINVSFEVEDTEADSDEEASNVPESVATETGDHLDRPDDRPSNDELLGAELEGMEKREAVPAPDHLIEDVRDYVSSVMDAMGLDARLDVYDTEEYVAVDIISDHTALIIGQKGETIDSLQYLVNSAVYKDREFVKRIVLDSEGYRQRRVEAIQGMAHRTARKSIREQRDIKMPPMNSSERRVVHVFLKENPEVTTFSEGSGSDRKVTVSPIRG